MSSHPSHDVALLGTGIMGAGMARMIAGSGVTVWVWNRTRAKADALASDRIHVASSAGEAVETAGVVVTMLADGDAVTSGMDEALPTMRDDAVWAQMSTVSIDRTVGFAARAASRGIGFVDAPVLGTKRAAEAGELLVLASGEDAAVDACTGVFEAVGARTVRLGPAGEGTKLKLVVNSWLLGMLGALAETISFARAVGVDPGRFLDTIEGGGTGTVFARVKGEQMIARDYAVSFPLNLARKDANLILSAAKAAGRRLPALGAVERVLAAAEEAGLGEVDMAALIEGLSPAT